MFEFETVVKYLPNLLHGALLTAGISAGAIVLAFLGGILLSQMRVSGLKVLQIPVRAYVSFIRGVPFIIQLFVIYYGISLIGVDMPTWLIGMLALAMNSAAYQSEYFRAGLESIPPGYIEAARALDMSKLQILLRIKMPLVFAKLVPPLTNEFILVLKNSAIVSIISVVELLRTGQQIITTTYRPTEIYIMVAAIYLVINLGLMFLINLYRRKQSVWTGRSGGDRA
ncbi:amino acid ABC transporter permease [Paenibacillus sp. FSL K6-1096]|uniref:amino acid ABC transporter permease n=1 Tax=Paenibacillus sp. FSL K6-1096 TaxID=2921460 RepID=UPI0030ED202D